MVVEIRHRRLASAAWGWLILALLVLPSINAAEPPMNKAERGMVLVYNAQGEQAKSDTARTALLIGNGSYPSAPLRNPVNDATDMAQSLRELGFEVVLSLDVDKRVLIQAMRKFRQRLQRRGGVGLFYYAGHGTQVRGRNYLIPVGADIKTEADVEYEAVDTGLVLRYMEEAEALLNIVILDACRDNPLERRWRSASRGLVRLELPQGPLGSLLAYATAPGRVAADGAGRNSPFTKHLLRNLRIAGLDLEDVFKRTRIGVREDTEGRQIPWSESSLLGDFYFRKSDLTPGADPPIAGPQVPKHPQPPPSVALPSNTEVASNTTSKPAKDEILPGISCDDVTPLMSWYSGSRKDNFATTDPEWRGPPGDHRSPDYRAYRNEGYLFRKEATGTVPVYSWYSPSRGDNFLTSDPSWAGRFGDTRSPDYRFVRMEGYVYDPKRPQPPHAVPLDNSYSRSRGDNFASSDPTWTGAIGKPNSPDYSTYRREGFILEEGLFERCDH